RRLPTSAASASILESHNLGTSSLSFTASAPGPPTASVSRPFGGRHRAGGPSEPETPPSACPSLSPATSNGPLDRRTAYATRLHRSSRARACGRREDRGWRGAARAGTSSSWAGANGARAVGICGSVESSSFAPSDRLEQSGELAHLFYDSGAGCV